MLLQSKCAVINSVVLAALLLSLKHKEIYIFFRMASTPEPSNHFQQPAGVDEYQSWFDADGRLVKEALMRQCLFEGKHPFNHQTEV